MNKVILKIGGMSCSACSSSVEKYLNKQEGIISASVNLVLAQALVEYDDSLKVSDIERFVSESGYKSLGVYKGECEKTDNKKEKRELIFFGILAFFLLYISMSHMVYLPQIPYLEMAKYPVNYCISLFLLVLFFLYYGRDIMIQGIKNLFHKSPNMDTLVMLGVMASFIYSTVNMIFILFGNSGYVNFLYFESISTIIFFIKLGRFIDAKSKEKTSAAIKELVQITPQSALLKTEDGEKEVTIDEVKKGDILIARPGQKIAVDGVIIKGSSHLDEAFITGEAIPAKKSINDKVVAGSMNLDGYIEYTAEKIGKDSTISSIVRLVVEATNTKAPIAHLADKVSGYFVPGIIIISILTLIGYLVLGFSFNEALISFVTVLVVACPCALGLATPLAIVVSEGLCAKNGILVKSSEILENAGKVDTIVFDKTGTLTYGNLKIAKIFNYSNYSELELIRMVASLEEKSSHPIASAFKDYASSHKIDLVDVDNFQNLEGIGLSGSIYKKKIYVGNHKLFDKLEIDNSYQEKEEELSSNANSIIYVIENNKVIGLIGVKDIIRENAKKTIQELKKLGIHVVMLTGDNEKTASVVAKEIGVSEVIANMLPVEKTSYIKNLLKQNKKVMMVGDGINDAPSLATASIGVSVNSGTDIALDSSDVILMQDNLEKIISLIYISRRTITNIKQNLFWAFFYNACMIPLAVGLFKSFGLSMNPMVAGIAMTLSSLTVIFNALRLRKSKRI